MRREERKKTSLLFQITILFILAIIATGVVTNLSLYRGALKTVSGQTEAYAEVIAGEVKESVREYPAYKWLLAYWYEHSDELDIEYDADFYEGTATKEKINELRSRQPSFLIRYADEEQVRALPPEDQKLYAEIAYSWLITRINQIKNEHNAAFLYCVLTNMDFDRQFFLFSAGDGVTRRGTEYEDVYVLGVKVKVDGELKKGMKEAVRNNKYLAGTEKYKDYYSYFEMVDGKPALIGLSYDTENFMNEVTAETAAGSISSAIVIVVLAVTCLILIIIVVLKPLKRIQLGIRGYIETKDSRKVAEELSVIKERNEIGQLSVDIVNLAGEIDQYLEHIRKITEEKGKIQSELALASRIQLAMMPQEFPPFPERSEFDLHAFINPAKEVGGDFYDFFFVDEDHLCFLIADVSGKGVPAALFMMVSKAILQSCIMLGKSAGESLEKTNEAICSNNKAEMFFTTWVGILEVSTGKLVCANAGHEYPALKRKEGRFKLFRDKHGLAIGFMDEAFYTEYEIQMNAGDQIFIYTDGLPEATDAEKNMFGSDRIVEVLNESPDADPKESIEKMKEAIDGFVKEAEQFDDLTMLCVRYNGR